jgi:uncharacterized protein (TIGR02996 family)
VVKREDKTLIGFLKRLMNPSNDNLSQPDLDTALVLADWLEEQDDPRAADVRAIAEARSALEKCPAIKRAAKKVFWRWPARKAMEQSWWDLLVESVPELGFYVRWHVDRRTEQGKVFTCSSSGETCDRDDIPLFFERCLAELIGELLGWSAYDLQKA